MTEDVVSKGSRWRGVESNYTIVIPLANTAMTLLAHRVPITLLADLLDPSGPRSREIYRVEAVADDVRRELASLAPTEVAIGAGLQAQHEASDFTTRNAAC